MVHGSKLSWSYLVHVLVKCLFISLMCWILFYNLIDLCYVLYYYFYFLVLQIFLIYFKSISLFKLMNVIHPFEIYFQMDILWPLNLYPDHCDVSLDVDLMEQTVSLWLMLIQSKTCMCLQYRIGITKITSYCCMKTDKGKARLSTTPCPTRNKHIKLEGDWAHLGYYFFRALCAASHLCKCPSTVPWGLCQYQEVEAAPRSWTAINNGENFVLKCSALFWILVVYYTKHVQMAGAKFF